MLMLLYDVETPRRIASPFKALFSFWAVDEKNETYAAAFQIAWLHINITIWSVIAYSDSFKNKKMKKLVKIKPILTHNENNQE